MRIFRNIWIVLAIIWSSTAHGAEVSYIISPNLKADHSTIHVTLKVEADTSGTTTLVYFDEAWGETNLFDCLESIKVLNVGARLKKVPEQNKIYIQSEAEEHLVVEYVVRQDFKGDPDKSRYYRPIINQDYFHLFGHRLFIIPEEIYLSEQQHDVKLEWKDEPTITQHNFGMHHSGRFRMTRDELLESIVVGGDFRKELIEVDGITLQLLTRGEWKRFTDEEIAIKLKSIVDVQRKFWNDFEDDLYTVTLLPINSKDGDYLGGTGLNRGFASYCSNSDNSQLENLTRLYYHEIMHHWIGGKIRNSTRTEELWFSEGFTEYFSYLLMKQEREISKREFNKKKNEFYDYTMQFAEGNITNDQLKLQSLSQETDLEKIPYSRGFLYACYLDKLLQKRTNGKQNLKTLMLKILNDPDRASFSNDYFKLILGQCLDQGEVEKFCKYILRGEAIDRRFLF